MDDKDAIRRVILNLLAESALRLTVLARYFQAEFLGAAFSELGALRMALVRQMFARYPDEALSQALQEPDATGF